MSMITAATWVPRGFAAPFPSKYNFDEEEFARIADLAKLKLDDAKDDLKDAQDEEANGGANVNSDDDDEADDGDEVTNGKGKKQETLEIDDDLKEYDLEHYDDDEEGADPDDAQSMGMFGNVKSLAYYENDEDDPYITLKEGNNSDDEEREELQILATDNLVLAAKVEDELAHLEIYVYEDEADNLYVHHDIMLPAIPLCVEWLDLPVGKTGAAKDARANFVAVGTADPDIELWDLDTVDCMYPNAILGKGGKSEEGAEKKSKKGDKKKKKKKRAEEANDSYHVGAVLSLAANRKHRNLLASASADKTIKLWDLHTTQCAKSYSYHTDKVCSVAWHTEESTVLLSGSFDRTIVAADMRAPEAKPSRWGVESDVETIKWDPHDANVFYVSTENGVVHSFDVRNAPSDPSKSKGLWKLQAHDHAVASLDINTVIPGFIATGSEDKTVKLWNVEVTGPSMVVSRNLDVGKVFATTFAPDPEVAFRLVVAGSKGTMTVWDTSTNASVRRAFATKLPDRGEKEVEERIVGVENDDSSSDDDDEGEEDGDGEDGAAVKGSGDESMDDD